MYICMYNLTELSFAILLQASLVSFGYNKRILLNLPKTVLTTSFVFTGHC